jgi:hypothetical protein
MLHCNRRSDNDRRQTGVHQGEPALHFDQPVGPGQIALDIDLFIS